MEFPILCTYYNEISTVAIKKFNVEWLKPEPWSQYMVVACLSCLAFARSEHVVPSLQWNGKTVEILGKTIENAFA